MLIIFFPIKCLSFSTNNLGSVGSFILPWEILGVYYDPENKFPVHIFSNGLSSMQIIFGNYASILVSVEHYLNLFQISSVMSQAIDFLHCCNYNVMFVDTIHKVPRPLIILLPHNKVPLLFTLHNNV